MLQSGGMFEASKFFGPCGVSHTTIANYLSVLEATYVAHVSRPSAGIVSSPKVYMFDTGFVCYYRGLQALKPKDMGLFCEHYVLNELQSRLQSRRICYWRDKQGHEIDFVIEKRGMPPVAIEAKWRCRDFDSSGMKVFARSYPGAPAYVATGDLSTAGTVQFSGLSVKFISCPALLRIFDNERSG